ncbi:MAG: hypothetical protein GW913_15385, partial [Myxococcales bacterium]|nr:hypothetical protein [Myxococcales bacterium]
MIERRSRWLRVWSGVILGWALLAWAPPAAGLGRRAFEWDPRALPLLESCGERCPPIVSRPFFQTTSTDAEGKAREVYRDVAEGIVTVVEHIEDRTRTATYAYLSTGELTSITAAAAAVTPMRHDLLGRRLSLDSADAGPTRFTRVGNLTSIVNARGVSVDARIPALTQQVELHNDDLHRLIRVGTWQSTTTLAPGTPLEAATTRVWDGTTRTWTLTSPEG